MYKLFLLFFIAINFSLFPSENNEVREVLPIESIHNDNLKNEADISSEKNTISDEEKDLFEKGTEEYALKELRATNVISTKKDLKENKKDEYNSEVKFKEIEISERTNRVMALGSAMGSVDLGKIEERKFRIGAGVGSSGDNQAVAVGVGYAPTDRFRVNTKFSTSSTSKRASAISIGASVDLDW